MAVFRAQDYEKYGYFYHAPDEYWVPVLVTEVRDGDTFQGDVYFLYGYDIYIGEKKIITQEHDCSVKTEWVRLANIDAPEIDQPYGVESRDYLKGLIEGKIVWCKMTEDSKDKAFGIIDVKYERNEDRFGRFTHEPYLRPELPYEGFDLQDIESSVLIAHNFLSEIHGLAIDEDMVSKGYAWNYPKYTKKPGLQVLQDQAQAAGLGLWGCQVSSIMPPWEYRHQKRLDVNFELPVCNPNT